MINMKEGFKKKKRMKSESGKFKIKNSLQNKHIFLRLSLRFQSLDKKSETNNL